MTYRITIAPTALRQLKKITDRRVRAKIIEAINRLAEEPEKQGKPLVGELAGYRSLRAVGQRYRIVYAVNRGEVTVIVVAVGLRRAGDREDIYDLARKLIGVALKGTPPAPPIASKQPQRGKRPTRKGRSKRR